MSTVNKLLDIATCDAELNAKMLAEIEEASRLAYEQHNKDWVSVLLQASKSNNESEK